MKASIIISTLFGSAAIAHPGMGKAMEEIKQIAKRQFQPSTEMLGELKTLTDAQLSTTGKAIKAILLGTGSPIATTSYTAPAGGKDAAACKADRCCVWKYIANDMRALFLQNGECTNAARGSIRLGFHDAATWNKTIPIGQGGADGSIILAGELSRPENGGLIPLGPVYQAWFNTYKNYGVTMADLVQFGAKVAAGSCPGGPRMRHFVGRSDNPNPNPTGLLPGPNASAATILTLFSAKTIGAGGVVALLGAHTASKSNIGPSPNMPQDSTPGRWDLNYFSETTNPNTPSTILKFQSDINIANDAATSAVWNQFKTNKAAWDVAYAAEYIRMSLMGFQDINGMVECSKVMPPVLPL
ncbi:heme peroxidase [Podospora conica]|nr:heme peroxidase [Schizothecium conicum]